MKKSMFNKKMIKINNLMKKMIGVDKFFYNYSLISNS